VKPLFKTRFRMIPEGSRTPGDAAQEPFADVRGWIEEHFTIGAKDANKCLSIHSCTRLRDDRIVVAWVGRHLTNTQT